MRRVENGLAHLPNWLVFSTRVNPRGELACSCNRLSRIRNGLVHAKLAKILNNNGFFFQLKMSWRGAGSFELFPYNNKLDPG